MVSVRDQKMLWGRAAGRCSIPNCRQELVENATPNDNPALKGENCHIVGESNDGPRGQSDLELEKRNSYENLILCCRNCHVIIDSQVNEYTVEKLKEIKQGHESWVKSHLSAEDAKKISDDQYYAEFIDKIEELGRLKSWTYWSSSIFSFGQPSLSTSIDGDLHELRRWMLKRPPGPAAYPSIDKAIVNFYEVLGDFHETFRTHAQHQHGTDVLLTEKFYQIADWNPERYHKLLEQYEFHVDLVEDLMLELTRAANLIIIQVRKHLISSYFIDHGDLSVFSGPHSDLNWREQVVRYSSIEAQLERPYPGKMAFMEIRTSRDMYYGKGKPSQAPA